MLGLGAAGNGFLAQHIGWRSGFLITPLLAAVALMLTVRYVPETARSNRKVDIPGPAGGGRCAHRTGIRYFAVAERTQPHDDRIDRRGILSAAAFVWWERRTDQPALDLRLFRSRRRFSAAVAGAASNLVQVRR